MAYGRHARRLQWRGATGHPSLPVASSWILEGKWIVWITKFYFLNFFLFQIGNPPAPVTLEEPAEIDLTEDEDASSGDHDGGSGAGAGPRGGGQGSGSGPAGAGGANRQWQPSSRCGSPLWTATPILKLSLLFLRTAAGTFNSARKK